MKGQGRICLHRMCPSVLYVSLHLLCVPLSVNLNPKTTTATTTTTTTTHTTAATTNTLSTNTATTNTTSPPTSTTKTTPTSTATTSPSDSERTTTNRPTWKDCSNEIEIEKLWKKSLSFTLHEKRIEAENEEESMCVDYEHMTPECKGSVQAKGYYLAKKIITEDDSDQLAAICHKLFGSRNYNSEHTHFTTGTNRLSMFMTRQHFFDLAIQSHEEHTTNKAKVDPPYEFVEHLVVWNDELTAVDVGCVLRVMRTKSKHAGAMWQQEFELVMTGTNGDKSPQMWHFDGIHANIAAVCVVPSGGKDGRSAVRGSTEFVRYPHKCLSQFATDQEKLLYLEVIWAQVTRVTITTQAQYDRTVRQDELVETLSIGSIIDCWPVECGDSTYFMSTHMHRGAGSRKPGYACFSAWEAPEYKHTDTHTDGTPVHKTNWKPLYTKSFAEASDSQQQAITATNNAQRAVRAASRHSN